MLLFGIVASVVARIKVDIPFAMFNQIDVRELIVLLSFPFLTNWRYALGVGAISCIGGPYYTYDFLILLFVNTVFSPFLFSFYNHLLNKVRKVSNFILIWSSIILLLYVIVVLSIWVLSSFLHNISLEYLLSQPFENYLLISIEMLVVSLVSGFTLAHLGYKRDFYEKLVIMNDELQKKNLELKNEISKRVFVENELKKEKDNFENILNNSPFGVMFIKEGKIEFLNNSFTDITGYRHSDVPTLDDWRNRAYPDKNYRVKVREAWDSFPDNIESKESVLSVCCKDGNVKQIHFKSADIGLSKNVLLLNDISEILNYEEKLKISEERFRELAELLPEIVYEIDETGKLTFINKQALEITGYSKKEFQEMFLNYSFFNAEDGDRAKNNMKSLYKGKKELVNEYIATKKDGSLFPVSTHTLPIIKNGKHCGARGIIIDISERKDAELKLQHSEERFRHLSSSAFETILIQKNGIIIDANEAVEELLGYTVEELLGEDSMKLTLPEFREFATERDFKNDEEPYEIPIIRKDGTSFYAEIHAKSSIYMGEKVRVVAIRDVTEKKNTAEQLQQAQKMETIGSLAGGLAHDFNNILGGIIGTLSIMKFKLKKNGSLDKSELEGYIKTMERSGSNATDMVKQLMTLSRKEKLEVAPVDLNQTIKHVIKICRSSFDKSIEIVPSIKQEKSVVKADPVQIEQILLNICINASHAMTFMRKRGDKWGGQMFISVDKFTPDKQFCQENKNAAMIDYWCLSIKDNGIGISEDKLDKIFDPFFTTKPKEKGTGLGLSMVYSIVEQHKGFIKVESEVGVGTEFKIYLPVHIAEVVEEGNDFEYKKYFGSGTLLVIDDDEVIRKTAVGLLEECGYKVITAEDGVIGVDLYKKYKDEIKLVILDMIMPKLSGKETYLELRKIDNSVKVLLATGFSNDSRVNDCLSLGIDGFIEKPYLLDTLLKIIKGIIGEQNYLIK